MASTIPLAKPYTPEKLVFPVALSRKVDGVPVKFTITLSGDAPLVVSSTRQGKPMPSVGQLLEDFAQHYVAEGLPLPVTFVGEVYQRGNMDADFKETSGIVRRQYDQSDQLAIALFDTDTGMQPGFTVDTEYPKSGEYRDRLQFLMWLKQIKLHPWVTPIDQYTVESKSPLESYAASFQKAFPKAEGMVARSYKDEWAPGKRTWGYQKVLVDPMIDLEIVGFEEAVSQHGEPLGMVGRLIASYKGTKIGIGPGKLTHAERTKLWELCGTSAPVAAKLFTDGSRKTGPCIAQIKHKADDSYDALRQPTFQCWRPDKDEPDA